MSASTPRGDRLIIALEPKRVKNVVNRTEGQYHSAKFSQPITHDNGEFERFALDEQLGWGSAWFSCPWQSRGKCCRYWAVLAAPQPKKSCVDGRFFWVQLIA